MLTFSLFVGSKGFKIEVSGTSQSRSIFVYAGSEIYNIDLSSAVEAFSQSRKNKFDFSTKENPTPKQKHEPCRPERLSSRN